MNIDSKSVKSIHITFDAGSLVPAPYHYAYTLDIQLQQALANYKIEYLHREELSEEEITDEGFTLDDDWQWEGKLTEAWQQALHQQVDKQSWPKKPSRPKPEEGSLHIRLLDHEDKVLFEGLPADLSSWEYFMQELVQGIYEIARREAPFQLVYKEIGSGNNQHQIFLEASFAQRTITARQQHAGMEEEFAQPDWKQLKSLMKSIYVPDYDYEQASIQEPKKRGKYLATGEGLWFKFGESLTEPEARSNSLERLEQDLKGLFKK
ncbi:hypothetical protein [Nafulsella turpanensis]|uniref:hypothetical protein n=1 Tax=Nafulsella turpanensis TaxID=1265690 RepID=UPI0003483977|nr:hypothetical protein [Nafulsella turpanensis]